MLGKQASIGMGAVKFLFLFGGCTSYLMILGTPGPPLLPSQGPSVTLCLLSPFFVSFSFSFNAHCRHGRARPPAARCSAGDSFHPLLLQAFGERWWTGRDAAIIAVGTICIFPLCLRTSLGGLKGEARPHRCTVLPRSTQATRSLCATAPWVGVPLSSFPLPCAPSLPCSRQLHGCLLDRRGGGRCAVLFGAQDPQAGALLGGGARIQPIPRVLRRPAPHHL